MDEWAARSIYEHLRKKLQVHKPASSSDYIFMDVDGITSGAHFPSVLEAKLNECSFLLAVIGPSWLKAKNKAGNLRLRDENDFVRREIETGLSRTATVVVPVFVNGATMPKPNELAIFGLKALSDCNALWICHSRLESDLSPIVQKMLSE